MNVRSKKPVDVELPQSNKTDRRKFPNLSFKYNVVKQGYI